MRREALRRWRSRQRLGSPAGDETPAQRLFLPEGYRSRGSVGIFDDLARAEGSITHQPDVYALAAYLTQAFEAGRLVDIGCGSAEKLLAIDADVDLVGLDHPITVERLAARHPHHRWLPLDLETAMTSTIPTDLFDGAVVICSDVIEHLLDPRPLLALLRACQRRAAVVLISTPDRVLVRGPDDAGPPANEFHVREWSLSELDVLLRSEGLTPTFVGHTVNNDRDLQKRTTLAVVDQALGSFEEPPSDFRVRAMCSCFNERDIIVQCVRHLLGQGVEVTVIDDWSTDGSWELLHDRFGRDDRVSVVRHRERPSGTYDWRSMLDTKERLGRESGADWVIHHDADEMRTSPWPGLSVRTALWHAQRCGFTAVDHTVIDFRPVVDGYSELDDPTLFFRHFEWGRRPGHFNQIRTWRNRGQQVSLADSGGHRTEFEGMRVSPYKFLLQHYPLRSREQSVRKVVEDRRARFNEGERALGWHTQYDEIDVEEPWTWTVGELEEWDSVRFHRANLVERISGVGIVR